MKFSVDKLKVGDYVVYPYDDGEEHTELIVKLGITRYYALILPYYPTDEPKGYRLSEYSYGSITFTAIEHCDNKLIVNGVEYAVD